MKRVAYLGMTEKCYRCKQAGHRRFECTLSLQNRTKLQNIQPEIQINLNSDFPMLDVTNQNIESVTLAGGENFGKETNDSTKQANHNNFVLPIAPVTTAHGSTHISRNRTTKSNVNGVNDDTDGIQVMSNEYLAKLRDRSKLEERKANDKSRDANRNSRSRSSSTNSKKDDQL